MQQRLTRHIVLIGMMGAGKTAVGTELARRLQVPFTDSDVEIESAAAMSIAEIFARDGEPFFRARESEVIGRILGQSQPRIISTGGGAWMQQRNRDAIKASALSVFLDCSLDVLWQRVRQRSTRPLLKTANPYASLSALLAERAPVYAQADLRLESRAGDSVETTTRRLIDRIGQHDATLLLSGAK